MPTFPPGTPQHVNLTFTPTWLFTPVGTIPNNVRIYNEGQNIVYVGQADVTVNTGLPLLPGGHPLKLTNVTTSLYAISALQVGSVLGTLSSATTANTNVLILAGGTFTTVSKTPSTGSTIVVQNPYNTAGSEAVSITAFGTTPATFTVATNMQFAHDTTNVAYFATPTYGQVSVTAGQL